MSQNALLHAKNPSAVWSEVQCDAAGKLASSTTPASLTAKGYYQIVGLVTATPLAVTIPTGATCALIQAETQSVRWRDDTGTPTDSSGMLLGAGETIFFTGNLSAFRAIQTAATATLNVSFYG